MATPAADHKNLMLRKGTHLVDLGEWVDPAVLTIVPPLVSLVSDILQQRGEGWIGNKTGARGASAV